MEKCRANVIFPRRGAYFLFGLGAPNKKVGADVWNGVGGIMLPGENIFSSAARELHEETGLVAKPDDFTLRAIMDFVNEGNKFYEFVRVYFFIIDRFKGEAEIKEEAIVKLEWFLISKLPEPTMAADPYFVPRILAGEKFTGSAHYL